MAGSPDWRRASGQLTAREALGLFAIGAAITVITGRNALYSGLRQVLFGVVAATITFGVGRLVGANLGG